MFTKGNTKYSEARYILKSGNVIEFQTTANSDSQELFINIDNIKINKGLVKIGDVVVTRNHPEYTYAQWKSHIIKWRYSNDDQIALLLNKDNSDDDLMYFNKMNEWRDWAGELARKLVSANSTI